MKKLIGMALMALFAITAANTVDAKVFKSSNTHKTKSYDGTVKHKTKYSNNMYATPIVKNKSNKHKVKL